jgi:CBS domain-containing protein/ribosome-associated translation inhibitor RaiA
MELRDIMTTDLVTIGPDESAGAAWSRMERERIRHLLVVEDGRLVGVLSNQDLGGRHGEAVRQGKTVRELMTPDVVTATPDTSLDEAFEIMREQPIGSLPVMEEGKLVGIVTATDVLDALARGGARVTRWYRGRKPDSVKRAPFAERIPRAQKVETTRATPLEVPAYIRSVGPVLGVVERDTIRRKLGRKLGKFVAHIERVSVRLEDVNGPRGGVDKLCRIKVTMVGMPTVVVEKQHEDLWTAIDGALAGAQRAVRRAIEKRRTR